jgi:hypothetical protein
VEILSNSLEILHNMPGHEDRLETYTSLTESLLSSLQPLVLQEVMGNNVSSLRESLYVYKKIKRYITYKSLEQVGHYNSFFNCVCLLAYLILV